jgi:hypothetical protein
MKSTQKPIVAARAFSTFGVLALPFAAFAVQGQNNIPNLFNFALNIINGVLVPLVFAVAFIVFLFQIYNYFIAGGAQPEKVDEGKKFLAWSLVGFTVMFSIWGLVNLLIGTLPFDSNARPPIPTFGDSPSGGGAGGTNSPSPSDAGKNAFGAPSAPGDGSTPADGSCAGNPNACYDNTICDTSINKCVAIPGDGTRSTGQSCLGNVNACYNGLTCATQSGDKCIQSANSGPSHTVTCKDGSQADSKFACGRGNY